MLIRGETVRKELVAKSLHEQSRRAGQSVRSDQLWRLPEHLIESELLAIRVARSPVPMQRARTVRSGDGGTIFLDEIGELPLSMQAKLLRVLETATSAASATTIRCGSTCESFAPHARNLEKMVEEGQFREDLMLSYQHV